jgi:hypothetical protein
VSTRQAGFEVEQAKKAAKFLFWVCFGLRVTMFPVPNPTATYWLRGPEYEKHHQYRSTETLPKTARVVVIGTFFAFFSFFFEVHEI